MILHVEANFETVYLVNGKFFEKIRLQVEGNEVIYITVLPLEASLSTYTIKLIGYRPLNAGGMCLSYKISENQYYIRLLERHSFIYSTKKQFQPTVTNNIYEFFKQVKGGNIAEARRYLTEELSSSVDNRSLEAFFEEYHDIVENKGYIPSPENSFFLIDKNNVAHLYTFPTQANKISNIISPEE